MRGAQLELVNVTIKEPQKNHMILFMLISPKHVLPKTLMKIHNLIYMNTSYSNGLLNFKSKTSGQGERGRPEVGFGNYDVVNKKLANVADGKKPNRCNDIKTT